MSNAASRAAHRLHGASSPTQPAAEIRAASTSVIRAARPADIDPITAIYRQAVLEGTGTFEIDPPDAAEMAARHARITSAGFPYLVAEVQDEVQGYAYASAYHQRQAYRFTVEDSVYVIARARGRGLGSALIDALIDRAAATGFRQMIAVIGDSANHGSIALHRRAGFKPVGVIGSAGWKHDRWVDVVLMQRALGDGRESPAT